MEEAMDYNDDVEDPRQNAPANESNPSEAVIVISDREDDAEPQNPEAGEAQEPQQAEDDEIVAKLKQQPEETQQNKPDEDEDDEESGQMCPICMDLWTNSGDHRLCALRCGHLFGHSCVLKWLQISCTAGNRRCPHCNLKAAVKDIRILYARKLSAVDTSETERLKQELSEAVSQKNRLEMEVSRCHMNRKAHEQQLANMASRIAELERQQSDMSLRFNESGLGSSPQRCKFYLEKTLEICAANGCRVLDHSPWYRCLVASHKSGNPLFVGFGVRKVDTETFQSRLFPLLHNQPIRDVSFSPNEKTLMLSVSFDKTVKILDVHNNIVLHGYPTDSQLWSGCWSTENSWTMLVGAANGSITEFDIRQTSGAVGVISSPNDRSPVVSLAAVPSNSAAGMLRGGFVAAHLNSCYAYEQKDAGMWTTRQVILDGPFVSVRYDAKSNHALISSRPNKKTPNAQHTVCTIEKGNEHAVVCNVVHTFNGGNSLQIMSRPCYAHIGHETFVAAHQESTKSIPLWSISSGNQVQRLSVSDPVLDICPFEANNSIFLATLSSSKLRIYKNR